MAGNGASVLRRAVEHWNRGDLEKYLGLYHADCVLHNPFGDLPGLGAIREFYRGFWTAFPSSILDLDEVIEEGDRVVARFTIRATHRGEFMGVPATGRGVTVTGITLLRFGNGQCVERWNQADFLGLLQQLGAIPTPT